jgi:hypothetical protein
MRSRLGPSQSSARPAPRPGAAVSALRRVLLEAVENLLGIAARLDGGPDVLLHVELDLVPHRVGGGRQARARQRGEVGLELLVAAHLLEARLRHRQESLRGDPAGDLVRLVVEVEELAHRLLVALLLEGHEVVLDAEGDRGAGVARHLGHAVVDLLLGVQLGGEGAEAHDHADLAVLEELEGAVGAVGLARVDLGDLVLVGQVGQERERLHVAVAVDGPPVARLPVPAVVPHPDRPLGLRLFGAQRQRVADRVAAGGLHLARGLHELVPGARRLGDARAGEQVAVVEERAGAREDREAVERVAIGAAAREGLEEILAGLRRQRLVRRVEQPVLRVARERVEVQDVGRLVVLDHGADLLVDRVPVDHLQVDLGPGLLGVLLREALPERPRVILAVLRDDDLDRLGLVRPAAPAGDEGARGDQRQDHQTAAHPHRAHTTKVPAEGVNLTRLSVSAARAARVEWRGHRSPGGGMLLAAGREAIPCHVSSSCALSCWP